MQVSPSAFFQTNIEQAELLHNAIAEAAGRLLLHRLLHCIVCSRWDVFTAGLEHSKAGVLLDLCCGTGTIGLSLARYVKCVRRCES